MKIYISPSVQDKNIGSVSYGSEEYEMNRIADVVIRELSKHKNIELKRNNPDMDWTGIRDASNSWHADYHVAIHSNAGGGRGCEIYHYVDGTENNSLKLAKKVYAKIEPITPSADRGLKSGMGLFEVNDTIVAASILIETIFHDNSEDVNWLMNHIEDMGQAITNGILDHLTIDRGIDTGLINQPIITTPQVVEKIVYVNVPGPERIVEVKVPFETKVVEYKDKIVKVEVTKYIEKEYSFKELILEILKYIKRLFVKIK